MIIIIPKYCQNTKKISRNSAIASQIQQCEVLYLECRQTVIIGQFLCLIVRKMLHPQTETKLSDWHGGHVVGDIVNLRVQRICKTQSRTRPSELNVQKSYSKSSWSQIMLLDQDMTWAWRMWRGERLGMRSEDSDRLPSVDQSAVGCEVAPPC